MRHRLVMAVTAILLGCSRPDPWVEGIDFPRPTLANLPLGAAQVQSQQEFGKPFTQEEHQGGGNAGGFMFSGGGQFMPMAPPDTQVDDRILNYVYRTDEFVGTGHKSRAFKTLYAGFRNGNLVFWDYHSNDVGASGTQFDADAVTALKNGQTTLQQAVSLLGQPSTLFSAMTVPSDTSSSVTILKPFPYTSTGLRYEMTTDEPDNKQLDTTLALVFDPSGRLKYADLKKSEHEKTVFPQPFVRQPMTVFIPTPSVHH